MGVVYAGLHEHLGREVAIKVLGAGIANDPVAVQRFLREARTASRLTHGNIVDVSDLGTLPDGRPYLVMARLNGEDLCSLLQRHGPQTPQRTVQLLRGAAAALDLIHAKGYLHRDVKPENLMHVVREDGSEAVLLLDFGIVGLVSPTSTAAADNTRLTAAGILFGTPVYIAPEVIRGGAPSALSDVYALATVAFELMTGSPPFTAPNVFDLLQSKLLQAAPLLRDMAGFELPEAVEQVVATGLERDASLRHSSAGAFVSALEAATQASGPEELQRMAASFEAAQRTRQRPASDTLERLITETALPVKADTVQLAPLFESGPTKPLEAVSATPSPAPPRGTHVLIAPSLVDRHWFKLVVSLGVAPLLAIAVRALWQDADARGSGAHLRDATVQEPQPSAAAVPVPQASPGVVVPPVPAEPTPAPADQPASQPQPAAAAEVTRKAHAPQTTVRKPPVTTTPAPADDARQLGANALVQQAQAKLIQGHIAAAQELYQRATQLDPRSAGAFRGLGLVEERLGHTTEAIRALRRALSLAPQESANPLIEQRLRKLEGGRP
jgi:serine/threonine-protein kinase